MSEETPRPLIERVRQLGRGVGEIMAFLGASAWAVMQFCLGRWPGVSRPPPPRRHPVKELAEKLTPYPNQD